MTVPPSAVLDPLEGGQLRARPDVKRRCGPIVLVQRHVGGRIGKSADHLADALQGLADFARRRLGMTHGLDRTLDDLHRCRDRVGGAAGDEVDRARLRRRHPAVVAGGGLGHRLEVEEDGADVDAGDAVDHRVVGLGQQGEAVALQALHEPELPERLRAVELLREDTRRPVA